MLRSIALGDGEGLAELRLPERFTGDLAAGYLLHPALLDLATGWAMELIPGYEPTHLWVPVSYRSVRVHGPLPAEIRSWVRIGADSRADGPIATFDVTLCDADGRGPRRDRGLRDPPARHGTGFGPMRPPTAARGRVRRASAGDQPLSPAEERLAHNLSQGIRPPEGADAFARALALGEPQVVVSSLDLDALIAQAAESGGRRAEGRPGVRAPRPRHAPTSSRATTSSGCSPASGRSCSASARSASRTASSTSAATR